VGRRLVFARLVRRRYGAWLGDKRGVKCGSLSLPTGGVQISLSVNNGRFELEWKERVGPKLTETPNHEGFGTNLVRRIVTGQFAGEVFYDWDPDGLVVRLMAPSDRLLGNDG
jgi:two-component sensor histidine kinase